MGRLDLRLLCPAVSLYCLSGDETCLRSCGIALLIHMANFELSLLRQSPLILSLWPLMKVGIPDSDIDAIALIAFNQTF